MYLQKLDIYHVRNIENATFLPSPAINFIFGHNASGKSSLLEAIYLLGRAKSFRSPSIRPVIQTGKSELIVAGRLLNRQGLQTQLGIRSDGVKFDIRVNGEKKSARSELAYALPLQFIHPKSYTLLDGGAQLRREFVDWGVFNLANDFLPAWRNYKKALSQRNALLKQKQRTQVEVWNHELAQYGTIVADFRSNYMRQFLPVFSEIANQLLAIKSIAIKDFPGWAEERTLAQKLHDDLEKDLRDGFTHSGPHRADFKLYIDDVLAKDYVSRGQLKLLVLALKLAQVKLLILQHGQVSCLLIDDVASELDEVNKSKLLTFLSEMKTQVFLTATQRQAFGAIDVFDSKKMFHVEHGKIYEV